MPHTAPRLKQPGFLVTAGTALVLLLGRPLAAEKAREANPAAHRAASTPCTMSTSSEHVTIAAEPGDTRETMPTRASTTGTRLHADPRHRHQRLRVGRHRSTMRASIFIAADNDVIHAATDDELQRAHVHRRSPAKARRFRCPRRCLPSPSTASRR